MAKKTDTIEIDGIKFSKDVDIEAILALGDKSDPNFEAAMKTPAKVRITTMVDEDIYHELKRLSKKAGHGKYQTFLNDFLRRHLLPNGESKSVLEEVVKALVTKVEKIARTQKTLEKFIHDTESVTRRTKKRKIS